MNEAENGEIPASGAITEAQVESLTELMSRDPQGYTSQDRQKIIAVLREQRERFAQTEAEAASNPKKAKKDAGNILLKKALTSTKDLGL